MNIDARSQATLAKLYPPFARMCAAAANTLALQGTYVCFFVGLRSAAEQNDLYAQGRTAPGHIVTNAIDKKSMHCYGLAVDAVPYKTGQSGNLNWKTSTPQYKAFVAAMKTAGCAWGGDWQGDLGDFDHFQIPGLGATPSLALQADYKGGTPEAIAAIWKRLAAGAYKG